MAGSTLADFCTPLSPQGRMQLSSCIKSPRCTRKALASKPLFYLPILAFFSLLPGVLRIGDINVHLFLRQFLFFVQITSVSSGCYVILGTLFRRDNSYRGCQQAVNFYGACPVSGASWGSQFVVQKYCCLARGVSQKQHTKKKASQLRYVVVWKLWKLIDDRMYLSMPSFCKM